MLSSSTGGKITITEKPQSSIRWLILVLTCLMMTGNIIIFLKRYYCFYSFSKFPCFAASYYTYDIPAALKTQIGDYMGNPSNYETLFSLLYTLYSIPNIVIPLFGMGNLDFK